MKVEKKPNIFWFIIDSVRSYRTGVDDRDRIDIMDEFAKESIEFTNCTTSAPSSLLSAGAMFTGLPAIYIARHFNDWKFKGNKIDTLATLVQNHGYQSIPLLNCREERERYQFLVPPFNKKILPKKHKMSDYAWRNKYLTEIFEHVLENKFEKEPFCFTLWYDCRRDPNTSFHVKKAIDLIKEKGYYENSIIIMHSDHGYPDPSTNLNEEFFKNIGHDMILTDDNIKVPFFIKYPKSPKNIKIKNNVGLIDVIPTIYDILKFPYRNINKLYQGKSLLPIINKIETENNRVVRSDTRLFADKGKVTSLRSANYKYIYFVDDNYEMLYDLLNDPKEQKNLIKNKSHKFNDILNDFRNKYNDSEKDIYNFHLQHLVKNFNTNLSSIIKNNNKIGFDIVLVTQAPVDLIRILKKCISNSLPKASFKIICFRKPFVNDLNIKFIDDLTEKTIKELDLPRIDLVLYLTENSKRVFLKTKYINAIKSIKAKNQFLLNFNFETFNYFSTKWFYSVVNLFFDWEVKKFFYKQEPFYFLKDLFYFFDAIFKRLKNGRDIDFDAMAAKEIAEFRNFHVKGADEGLNKIDDDEFEYEFDRLKTRE